MPIPLALDRIIISSIMYNFYSSNIVEVLHIYYMTKLPLRAASVNVPIVPEQSRR